MPFEDSQSWVLPIPHVIRALQQMYAHTVSFPPSRNIGKETIRKMERKTAVIDHLSGE